jgi:ABC-type nitrate/sulfonate/bicarbonate transport system ATPase subunit
MSSRSLRLESVSHSFGAVEVLRDLRLDVLRGEVVALIGPSGCGKTTLLNVLSGFLSPSTGTVTRLGGVRMVYQEDGLFPWLTARENVALGLRHLHRDADRRRRTEEMLSLIGLNDFADFYPYQLSRGMRQRVELARALADNAEILLLDEPFSALDYPARLKMRWELIRLLRERPRTVVVVTHSPEEAAQLSDRVVVLTERPARIRCELTLDVPHPRDPVHPDVIGVVGRLLEELGLKEDVAMMQDA